MAMTSNGFIATTLSPTRDTISSSQLLSSSLSSLSSPTSRRTSSQISKIYRQSSTLFLTRRLPESLSTILPVITSAANDEDTVTDNSGETAPIAKASRTTRIKVWSLYLTILNAVLELDPEEGKQAFGSSEYRALVSKVREGEVWEEVVTNGYFGVEGDVDSDVVINLATLLLAHARSQKTNQQRLENYLATSSAPNLDLASRLSESRHGRRSPSKTSAGTDTPRDLNARVKILELYTLHVLLRNNEWDYAREFISISEVLDEERREAFLQALQSLQDEQREVENREKEERRYREDVEEQRRKREKEAEERRLEEERERRVGSEVDYGVEDAPPRPGSSKSQARSLNGDSGSVKGGRRPVMSPTTRSSKPPVKKLPPPTLIGRAGAIIANLRKVLESLAGSFRTNPMILLRILAFLVGILMVFSKRDVREKIQRVLGSGWLKVRQTAGMGVKVSYI